MELDMDKIVRENRDIVKKENGEIQKKQIKKQCKIQSPRPICVPHDNFMVDRFQVT